MEIHSGIFDKRRFLTVIADMLNSHYVPRFDHPGMEERFGSKAVRGAKAEFLKTFRRLVDQWIDSGKSGPDRSIDSPQDRDTNQVPPGCEKSLFEIRADWLGRNPPRWWLNRNGVVDIRTDPPRFNPLDLDAHAQDQAGYYLEVLLDSPTRERLSRCDECRSYFVRARAPKKDTPIFRGTFCPNCKGTGSVKRMRATREDRANQMVELAGDFWPKWKPKAQYGKRSKWIAEMMNKRRTSRPFITGKWVTQHQQEIEAEAERRNHAKG